MVKMVNVTKEDEDDNVDEDDEDGYGDDDVQIVSQNFNVWILFYLASHM